jgi:hypothetical protein
MTWVARQDPERRFLARRLAEMQGGDEDLGSARAAPLILIDCGCDLVRQRNTCANLSAERESPNIPHV